MDTEANIIKTHCDFCGDEILYPDFENERYLASSEYEPNFPGYCHSCLVDHCLRTDCVRCDLRKYPKCEFLASKKIYLEED